MKSYKEFDKVFIGYSDIASLILAGCRTGEGLVTEVLDFGEDGRYTAYIVERSSSEEVTIGDHYRKEFTFNSWIRIYDDEELTFHASADSINIYTAGNFGCIIELIRG